MKKSKIILGVTFILMAIYLVGNNLELIPDVPVVKILFTLLMTYCFVKGLEHKSFYGTILSLCGIAYIYDDFLGIEEITPWTLLMSGILLSTGLSILFKKKKIVCCNINAEHSTTENTKDGQVVRLENSFNSVSKYVNTDYFSEAYVKNTFGSCNMYFNNAIMASGSAKVKLENSFGEINVYLPKTWRMELTKDVTLGAINVHGAGNADMDAPFVQLVAESSFGEINIYFE